MGDFWSTFFYIVVMIAVIVAAYIVTKYLSGKGRRLKSRHIRIVDRMILGRDKHIVLIEVGDKNLLLGITNQTINVLGHFDGQTFKSETDETTAPAQKGFASHLRDFIINIKDAPDNLNKSRMEAKTVRKSKKSPDEDDYLSRMDDMIQKRENHMADQDKESE